MCHEVKPHIKLWLMLINPSEWKSMNAFDPKLNIDDADREEASAATATAATSADTHLKSSSLRELSTTRAQDAPLLLRDPIAMLLLLISNLPVNIDKSILLLLFKRVLSVSYIILLILLSLFRLYHIERL